VATKYVSKFESADQLAAFAPDVPGSAPIGVVSGTLYFYNGTSYVPVNAAAPVSLTAGVTLTPAAHAFRTLLINAAAGIAIVLPAATGSGNEYRGIFGTTLTSNATTVTAPAGSVLNGLAIINNTGDSSAATVDAYPTGASDEQLSFTASVGAGKAGDSFEITDVASGVYAVRVFIQGEADPVNPFGSV
jgi:hypothetical protein